MEPGPTDPAVPAPPPGAVPTPVTPTARRRWPLVAAVVAVGVVIGGVAGAFFLLRGSGEQLLGALPARTDVVATVYLDPAADQKINLLRLAERFPALGSEQELTGRVGDFLDRSLQGVGLKREDLGWIGSQLAIAVDLPQQGSGIPTIGLVAATDDPEAATSALAKLRTSSATQALRWTSEQHDGVEVWVGAGDVEGGGLAYAVVDDTVVVSNGIALIEGVIATAHGGPSLQDDPIFTSAVDTLPTDRLALLYVKGSSLAEALPSGSAADPAAAGTGLLGVDASKAMAMTIAAEPDGLAIEAETIVDPAALSAEERSMLAAGDRDNPLMTMVPAETLALLAQQNLGSAVDAYLTGLKATSPEAAKQLEKAGFAGPDGVLSTLSGDLVVMIDPDPSGGSPNGALLLGGTDDAKMLHGLQVVAAFLDPAHQVRWSHETYGDVAITYMTDPTGGGLGFAPAYAVVDGAGVIATSRGELRRVVDTANGGPDITSEPRFTKALEGMSTSDGMAYVDLAGLIQAVRDSMAPAERADFDTTTFPNLEPLDAFVMGMDSDESHQHLRMFLQVR